MPRRELLADGESGRIGSRSAVTAIVMPSKPTPYPKYASACDRGGLSRCMTCHWPSTRCAHHASPADHSMRPRIERDAPGAPITIVSPWIATDVPNRAVVATCGAEIMPA